MKRSAIVIIVIDLVLAAGIIASLIAGYMVGPTEAQVVATVPVVGPCTTFSSVTVCRLSDGSTQRNWLIVGSAQGSIAVVEDEIR